MSSGLVLEPGSSRVNNRLTPARGGLAAGPPLLCRSRVLLPCATILSLQPCCSQERPEAMVVAQRGGL